MAWRRRDSRRVDAVFLAAVVLSLGDVITASTVLLVPFPSYSHVDPLVAIGEVLVDGGSTVYVLLPSLYTHAANLRSTSRVKVIEYQVKAWQWNAAMHAGRVNAAVDYFDYVTATSELADIAAKHDGYYLLCKELLSSKILDRHLRRGAAFDLGVVDSHPLTRCHYALMYKYGIPYVSYSQVYDPWFSWSPAMPSYVPTFLAERPTDRMTFWQRVVNAWTVVHWYLANNLPAQDDRFVAEHVPDKPAVGVGELALRSRLWLSDANFLLDFSRPIVANEVLVGWATMREARPLPSDHPALEGMNGTRDGGLVVVALDQNIALPGRVLGVLAAAFRLLPSYRVVWQYSGDVTEESIPNNVRVLPYVALNDLIGHPKARLLVTSADGHHQNMALYHGVPALCIPLHPTQRHNAHKTALRRHGLVLEPGRLGVRALVQAMRRLLQNDTFHRNVAEPSRIMRMKRPAAQQSVAQWIELSVVNEFDALRPYAVQMTWPKYAMLDVAAMVAVVFGNAIFLVVNSAWLGIKRARRLYRGGQPTTAPNRPVKPVLPSTAAAPINKTPGAPLSPITSTTPTKPSSFKQH